MNNFKNKLYIVVPCYNEEEVLPITAKTLLNKVNILKSNNIISCDSKVLFVNDGSNDNTLDYIKKLNDIDNTFIGISLSKNRGHQNALLAGLMYAKDRADIIISMDADLQDDVNAVDEMIDKYYNGCDIVYGVRSDRKNDTVFKKSTAQAYYKIMNKIGVELVYNHADYRLMSKRAVEALSEFKEKNLFLRGIVPKLGFKTDCVYYERGKRQAGESKYPLRKMLSFAIQGITSFSVKPIRLITFGGFLMFIISMITLIVSIVKWHNGVTVTGWTSLICSIWAIGGIIMVSLGIIGEYIGKIYIETKQRPNYFIDEIIGDE